MAGRLESKVALITGASSGIGARTALALASEGARVGLLARSTAGLDDVASQVRGFQTEALTLTADIADEGQIRAAVEQVCSSFGRLDVLVNSAGVMLLGSLIGAKTGEWRRMIDINVLGLMYATHAALPTMLEQGSGHIVNISSVAGRFVWAPGAGVYQATKFAVGAFSESLRQEVAPKNIRVTVIEPGIVATKLTQNIADSEARQEAETFYASITPLQPDDIAAAILYAVTQPAHVNVNEMLVRPTQQLQ